MPYVTLEQITGRWLKRNRPFTIAKPAVNASSHSARRLGYEVYPFDRQIEEFGDRFRIVIPDRSGYGQSSRAFMFTVDFHQRAAQGMLAFLDALGWERCALGGTAMEL